MRSRSIRRSRRARGTAAFRRACWCRSPDLSPSGLELLAEGLQCPCAPGRGERVEPHVQTKVAEAIHDTLKEAASSYPEQLRGLLATSLFGDVTAALREHILATLDEHCGDFAPGPPAGCAITGGREPGDARRLRRDPRDEGRPGAALPCRLLSVTSRGGTTLTEPPFGAAAGISNTSRVMRADRGDLAQENRFPAAGPALMPMSGRYLSSSSGQFGLLRPPSHARSLRMRQGALPRASPRASFGEVGSTCTRHVPGSFGAGSSLRSYLPSLSYW